MPNINLRDRRNRDARVRAESLGQSATVRYVAGDGSDVKLRHVLKATSEHGLDRLLAGAEGDDAKLAAALVAGDPDVDVERIGMFLTDTSRVYVNAKGDIAYQIQQIEIVRGPSGEEKERRPRRQAEPNTESEIPISWTGRLVKRDEAIRRFVFSSKLQIVHVNGLTYDFLYGMAKELAEADSLMLLGAGKSGKEPLMFRRGSTPYRGFLEGRIDGEKYVLLLHLSKMELKLPAVVDAATATVTQATDAAVTQPATATVPTPEPKTVPVEAPATVQATAAPAPEPAARKPTVADVLAATSDTPPASTAAKNEIADTVATAKAGKQRKSASAVRAKAADPATTNAPSADDAPAKPAAKPRARKPKPATETPST